jgi:hypothetical protein
MMLTFLLSVAICVLALLMWHACARACRGYIEQRQPSAWVVPITRTLPAALLRRA